ncbi:glycosyl hydrolase family 8 [Mucilaginibacter sp. dw_454]|uniref:glycosyl hydrolase family 8 n=1 Tax=Mucilaginibacter sp. dw_454 TaxID=2720079 RepID=UPI001BD6C7E2|nr:glycosyl hydrolase family 8 [Mucilaginibacter sp. dw_454]
MFLGTVVYAQQPAHPFPQHAHCYKGVIVPSHISQAALDKTTANFYDQWKPRYLKNVPGKPQSFVWFEGKGGKQCVSEGQGYGMVITVLMAGHDPNAKFTYDNLFRYVRTHRSQRSKYLMAWAQKNNGQDLDKTTATDGDLDIAYSLLLAAKQWGNKSDINYQQEARAMINEIMRCEINPKTWTILLGEGLDDESGDWFATRTSDFMPAHFKAFQKATGDNRWEKVIDAEYKLFKFMQDTYSPDAGLLPDFIIHLNKTPKPAGAHFLESVYDGQYNYNACRDPWRIGTDYILNGDRRSKAIVVKINTWVRETTSNDTYNLSAGYTLEGNDIQHRYFEALSFVAPFGVSAMVDAKNQAWLNKVWIYLTGFKIKDYDYYDNSIKLLNMIIMSGNYWE